jgi:hypothetical protein
VCFLLESLKEGEKHKSFIETALAKIALNYVIYICLETNNWRTEMSKKIYLYP